LSAAQNIFAKRPLGKTEHNFLTVLQNTNDEQKPVSESVHQHLKRYYGRHVTSRPVFHGASRGKEDKFKVLLLPPIFEHLWVAVYLHMSVLNETDTDTW
jgi:hypothetical protein